MTDSLFDNCIQRIISGDKSGLKEIYEEYLGYIYPIVYGILKNKEDAEDVTSAFFIRLWTTARQYHSGSGHKAYITTIARNMCFDHLRKNSRSVSMDLSGEDEETDNQIQQEQTAGFENEIVDRLSLSEALQTLKENERQIIHMKIYGEMTFREISEILKIPAGTISWQYREALKKLRRYGYE